MFHSEGVEGLEKLVKRRTLEVGTREKIMNFLESSHDGNRSGGLDCSVGASAGKPLGL